MKRRLQVRLQADEKGVLQCLVPVGEPGAFFQVEITLEPEAPSPPRTPEELGYPPGWVEQVVGKWEGELERPPQGECDKRLDLD